MIVGAPLAVLASPAAEASDPTEPHRWHMPRRGARKLAQEAVGPLHAEWNRFGQLLNDGKGSSWDRFHDKEIVVRGSRRLAAPIARGAQWKSLWNQWCVV